LIFPLNSAVFGCSQYRVLGQQKRMSSGLCEEGGGWVVERGEEEVVMVAEAVDAGWNKVTFRRLVDRCMEV